MINNIIDIHSHIIFGVDDGAKTLEDSIASLKQLKEFNINKVICTPHLAHARIEHIKKIKENYIIIRDIAKKEYDIDLYLGSEILINSETTDLLLKKRLRSLDGKNFVLVEFKRTENMQFDKVLSLLEDIIDLGYRPILAHPELYINYRDIKKMQKIREAGVLFQLDSMSILRKYADLKTYKFAIKLINEDLIDFVASDSHSNSKRNYEQFIKSYNFIKKKYSANYADLLFCINPSKILK